jgi:hypothetical protein
MLRKPGFICTLDTRIDGVPNAFLLSRSFSLIAQAHRCSTLCSSAECRTSYRIRPISLKVCQDLEFTPDPLTITLGPFEEHVEVQKPKIWLRKDELESLREASLLCRE